MSETAKKIITVFQIERCRSRKVHKRPQCFLLFYHFLCINNVNAILKGKSYRSETPIPCEYINTVLILIYLGVRNDYVSYFEFLVICSKNIGGVKKGKQTSKLW